MLPAPAALVSRYVLEIQRGRAVRRLCREFVVGERKEIYELLSNHNSSPD